MHIMQVAIARKTLEFMVLLLLNLILSLTEANDRKEANKNIKKI